MPNDLNRTQRIVSTALKDAFGKALEKEQTQGRMVVDLRSAKFIIFSDHHKGNRDGADDFRVCERAYNAALAYYDRMGYTLVVMGDVEELWEGWPEQVLKAYAHTMELEGNFHRDGRYLRFWGNHDDDWSHPDLVKEHLVPALGGGDLDVQEAMILHIQDRGTELGRLFLVHGHQGTLESDRIAPLSKFVVRWIWRPIQRIFKHSLNTPAKDFELRHVHDSAMYSWSQSQDKVVLIAGHTHRPVFKSESHEDVTRKLLQETEAKRAKYPDNRRYREETAHLAAELEWILAQNQQSGGDAPLVEFKKPSYFNTGCCAFIDGDITGLEIADGEIRLVRWPDDEEQPRPKVLVKAKLKDVLEAC